MLGGLGPLGILILPKLFVFMLIEDERSSFLKNESSGRLRGQVEGGDWDNCGEDGLGVGTGMARGLRPEAEGAASISTMVFEEANPAPVSQRWVVGSIRRLIFVWTLVLS